jgi:hypothetical protein
LNGEDWAEKQGGGRLKNWGNRETERLGTKEKLGEKGKTEKKTSRSRNKKPRKQRQKK